MHSVDLLLQTAKIFNLALYLAILLNIRFLKDDLSLLKVPKQCRFVIMKLLELILQVSDLQGQIVPFRLQIDQLLVIALAHDPQIFALLHCSLKLALQTTDLCLIDGCVIGSYSICVQVCYDVNKIFLLNWVTDLVGHIRHLNI